MTSFFALDILLLLQLKLFAFISVTEPQQEVYCANLTVKLPEAQKSKDSRPQPSAYVVNLNLDKFVRSKIKTDIARENRPEQY